MQNSLVSVIIPVYNVEKYFAYCMESVLRQTYRNLEIILVDDGSTDGSGRMCDEYAQLDTRVKVIHKKNEGPSVARNVALEQMRGEYIVFVDSDDYVRLDYVEILLTYAVKDGSDMVFGNYMKIVGDLPYSQIMPPKKHLIYSREDLKLFVISRKIPMYADCKLYKAVLFEKIRFPVGKLYEEIPTIWNVLKIVQQATYVDTALYFYRQHAGSIVNTRFNKQRMDLVYATEQLYSEVKEEPILGKAAAARCFFSVADNYTLITRDFPREKKYLEKGIRKYRKAVLQDPYSAASLKLMAMISYISPKLVRIAGRCYKQYHWMRWKAKQ